MIRYSVRAVNLTPIPLPVQVCGFPTGGIRLAYPSYRYRVEIWRREDPRWTTLEADGRAGDCSGVYPHQEWRVWWPGASIEFLDWSATPDQRLRFTVFVLSEWPDNSWLQTRLVWETPAGREPPTTQ